jgi:hypothetical protein
MKGPIDFSGNQVEHMSLPPALLPDYCFRNMHAAADVSADVLTYP